MLIYGIRADLLVSIYDWIRKAPQKEVKKENISIETDLFSNSSISVSVSGHKKIEQINLISDKAFRTYADPDTNQLYVRPYGGKALAFVCTYMGAAKYEEMFVAFEEKAQGKICDIVYCQKTEGQLRYESNDPSLFKWGFYNYMLRRSIQATIKKTKRIISGCNGSIELFGHLLGI